MSENSKYTPAYGPDIHSGDIHRDYNHIATLLDYLGRTMLSLGTPAFRIESALSLFARRFGSDAQVMSSPTMMVVTLRDRNDERTFMVRENPGPTDFGKIARLSEVMNGLSDKKISLADACSSSLDIYRDATHTVIWLTLFAYVITSVVAVVLMGGYVREMILAALLGLLAAGFNLLARRYPTMDRLQIPLASLVISFVANLVSSLVPGVSYIEPIFAGLITLLPGLAITIATRELATAHVLAGSTRLAGAAVVLLGMIFGSGIGAALSDAMVPEPYVHHPRAVENWVLYALAPLMGLGLSIRFRAQRRDWPVIMVTCLVAMAALSFQKSFSDPITGAFIAATVIGTLGNLFAHWLQRPATIVHVPGLLLLVPGSLSLNSMAALMLNDVVGGIEGLVNALMTAMALTTGMILASVVMPPRSEL